SLPFPLPAQRLFPRCCWLHQSFQPRLIFGYATILAAELASRLVIRTTKAGPQKAGGTFHHALARRCCGAHWSRVSITSTPSTMIVAANGLARRTCVLVKKNLRFAVPTTAWRAAMIAPAFSRSTPESNDPGQCN